MRPRPRHFGRSPSAATPSASQSGFPLLTGGPLVLLGALLMYLPGLDSLGALIAAQLVVRRPRAGRDFRADAAPRRRAHGSPRHRGSVGAQPDHHRARGLRRHLGRLPAAPHVRVPGPRPSWARWTAVVGGVWHSSSWPTPPFGPERLFMDGYSFVASALVGACLWGAWLLRREDRRAAPARGRGHLRPARTSSRSPLYSLYRPVGFATDPLATFRSMGLDLITLVTPSNYIWFASKLGIAADHTDLAGDTTNAMYNYAGFACVGLATWYLVRRRPSRFSVALAVAGAIALVLSLGPALKVDVERPGPQFVYNMPAGRAPELPWAGLFVEVPGLKAMRASYRWYGVTRMALIMLAGLGIAALARDPRRSRRLLALAACRGRGRRSPPDGAALRPWLSGALQGARAGPAGGRRRPR